MKLRMLLVAAAVLASPAVAQDDQGRAVFDPATCETQDGANLVGKAFLEAGMIAKQNGRMTDGDFSALMALMMQWDKYYNETGDLTQICKAQIVARRQLRF